MGLRGPGAQGDILGRLEGILDRLGQIFGRFGSLRLRWPRGTGVGTRRPHIRILVRLTGQSQEHYKEHMGGYYACNKDQDFILGKEFLYAMRRPKAWRGLLAGAAQGGLGARFQGNALGNFLGHLGNVFF